MGAQLLIANFLLVVYKRGDNSRLYHHCIIEARCFRYNLASCLFTDNVIKRKIQYTFDLRAE